MQSLLTPARQLKKDLSLKLLFYYGNMWKSWIPNGLSLGNLSFGFLSIVIASSAPVADPNKALEIYIISGIFIIIAVLFDGLDGPMARMLKVESAMGEQLDSLADLTTFGIAPGFLMYKMYLSDIFLQINDYNFPLGMVIAALHPICAAYRLARFNVAHDPKTFLGLPSPMAGIVIAMIPLVNKNYPLPKAAVIALFLLIAFLMVSNIKYSKPQVSMKAHFTVLRLVLFIILASVLVFSFGWHWVVVAVIILYIMSGIIALCLSLIQKLRVGYKTK